MAAPKAGTRLSPGVYANGKGGTQPSSKVAPKPNERDRGAKGILSNPPPKSQGGVKQIKDKYTGLNESQNLAINQRTQGDISLGNTANQQLDQIQSDYGQPFDWSQVPGAPGAPDFSQVAQGAGAQDYNTYVQSQIDQSNKAFDSRNEPIFAKQAESFRQRMYNQGIPENSPAYAAAFKAEIADPQNDARIQAQSTAMTQAGTTGTQFANIQNQAHQQGFQDVSNIYGAGRQYRNDIYGDLTQKQGKALNDYNSLYGSTSPFATQNLGYSQGLGTANNATANAIRAANATRGGGGGGGRGGGQPATPFDINTDPATQRWLFQQQYANANAPQAPSQPSYAAQLGGGIFGSFASGLGQSFGKYLGS